MRMRGEKVASRHLFTNGDTGPFCWPVSLAVISGRVPPCGGDYDGVGGCGVFVSNDNNDDVELCSFISSVIDDDSIATTLIHPLASTGIHCSANCSDLLTGGRH